MRRGSGASGILLVGWSLTLASAPSAAGRAVSPQSIHDSLTTAAPLSRADAARVVQASREAIAGKAFRLTGDGGSTAVHQMGPDGLLKFTRTEPVPILTEYTGQPGRYCDGSPAFGELAISYQRADGKWIVNALSSTPRDAPIFATLAGALGVLDEGPTVIDGRPVRQFTAQWNPPGGYVKPQTVRLWIDIASLLPVRFAFSLAGAQAMPALSFEYDATIDLHRPDDVKTPDCIER